MPGILVGIDGSGHSKRALEWAMKEAALRQTSLTVLAVHQVVTGWGGAEPFPGDQELIDKTSQAAKAETDKVLAGLEGPHPQSVTVRTVQGFPAEEIINAGADADLIVVGSRGAGGFGRMLVGSVPSQVVQHAHKPVVIIPREKSD
jgi:nucleotide-binding universal stress UspA family protein